MKQPIKDCNCEDFPCCVHADNYAVPASEFEQEPQIFECESTCCECSYFDECEDPHCDLWDECEHRECGLE